MAANIKTDQVIVGSSPKPLPAIGKPYDPITRYLLDELKRQQSLINQLAQSVVVTADVEPPSPRQGMVRRAVSPWDPIGTGYSGLVEFDGTIWKVAGGDIAALPATPDTVSGYDSSGDAALFPATTFGRSLLDDADAAAGRTTLGLGTAATLDVGTGANDVVQLDGSGALPAVDGSQLTGFGTAAALDVGTGANDVVQLDGSAKLPAVDGSQLTGLATMPTGAVIPFAGTSEPTGYLFCYGQAVSRTTYSALFTALSTTYGVGDGSTTFNLPDLRGRVVAGQDDMGGSSANRLTGASGGVNGDVLGAAGGAETHSLTTAQLASHTHTVSADGNGVVSTGTTRAGGSADAQTGTFNTGSAGSGNAHNNVQPTIILNYIIKT